MQNITVHANFHINGQARSSFYLHILDLSMSRMKIFMFGDMQIFFLVLFNYARRDLETNGKRDSKVEGCHVLSRGVLNPHLVIWHPIFDILTSVRQKRCLFLDS